MGRVAVDDGREGRRTVAADDSAVAMCVACRDMSRVGGILRDAEVCAEVSAPVSAVGRCHKMSE